MDKAKKHKSLNMSNSKNKTMPRKEGDISDISNFSGIEPDYKKLVDMSSKDGLDFYISNFSLNHAKYVIYTLIKNTKEHINIFSSKLNNDLFCDSNIIQAINSNNDMTMHLLLTNPTNEEIENFKKLIEPKKIKDKKVEIRKINNKEQPYFIVSDNTRLRIQSNIDSNKAKVNFNDKSMALHLNNMFLKLWELNPKSLI